ncbi:unnamed protein product [Polarella glacialis]|uniref:Anaphase-promoting complex subunit 5 domain-containing protein n=1 Tax=Polarella glacialis TaxID=89957 RepID=A0A813JH41_POLGL|nr:unnamed protein product [Polarella glacialis]
MFLGPEACLRMTVFCHRASSNAFALVAAKLQEMMAFHALSSNVHAISPQVEYELDEGLISFGSCLERGQYAKAVNRLIQDHAAEVGGDGSNYYMAQAKMAMLAKQFQRAEELHKYDESIRLAERKNHPKVLHLKNFYLQWLLSTQQEAGLVVLNFGFAELKPYGQFQ